MIGRFEALAMGLGESKMLELWRGGEEKKDGWISQKEKQFDINKLGLFKSTPLMIITKWHCKVRLWAGD